METKNLIVIFIWTFALATVVGLWWTEERLIFGGYLILFFIALISSIAVVYILSEKNE